MKPLRVAVVGLGHLGRIHARRLREIDGISLAGVVESDTDRHAALLEEFAAKPYAHHREIVGRADAAVIAAPTAAHHEIACDLLRAGLHLFIEKPIALTSEHADELVQLAREQRVVLQVGHVERFNPAWLAARPYLRRPKYIEAVRKGGYTFRSTDVGVVLDLMIHDIDLVLSLVQSPLRQVEALGASIFGRHEDMAHARLTFANGCVATLSASRASHRPQRSMNVWSPESEVTIDFAARTAEVVHPSETLLQRRFDPESLSNEQKAYLKDRLLAEHLPVESLAVTAGDAILAELTDFVTSIRAGRSPKVCGRQGHSAVAVAETILEQIAEHQWNGTADGPVGPLAAVRPNILPGPHWRWIGNGTHSELRREAG